MPLKLITAPAAEPILLADVHAQLGIPTADVSQDAVITRRIAEAREWAEAHIGRALITQTWELALDVFPACEIQLPMGPVQSITSIKYIDTSEAEQTIDAADYTLSDYGPQHYVMPGYGLEWPSTITYPNAVKIRYVAGYGASGASVPGPIREALLLLVGHWLNFQSGIEGATSVQRIPYAVLDLLAGYKMHTFGG